ncbi:hypothetical protein FB45DRAFT_272312 [Roridomyces roridus]|uniref:DUF6699 domain-containing protein n=1 Tax=Roridomyces roridus TaxID=1738132 RepID=A0AAD7B8H4_9AGAR|nr:hypothetical protein FB45DRAFT_272312 [Roridomyces roridus]
MPGRHRGRHVHFSGADTFYPPSPPVPGLTFSVSSKTSSSGPATPPTPAYATLPGPTPYEFCLPEPKAKAKAKTTTSTTHQAHALLEHSDSPLLNYDVSLPPSSISTHYHGITSARMLEPAVSPPQAALTLHTPHLPWSITIEPTANERTVTVSDVLNGLHRALRANVTPAEFRTLGSEELMGRAADAYRSRYRRCKRNGNLAKYAEEKAQGVKRIDFLMGWNGFRGISATSKPGVWRLHLA